MHVCAAPVDRAWVESYLLPSLALSKGQVHTRDDDQPGQPRIDEIDRATTRAQYTVLVLSQAFVSDDLSDYARSLTAHAAVQEGRLLLIAREACELPMQLDYLVRLKCYKGDDANAWEREMALLRALLELEGEALARWLADPNASLGRRSLGGAVCTAPRDRSIRRARFSSNARLRLDRLVRSTCPADRLPTGDLGACSAARSW